MKPKVLWVTLVATIAVTVSVVAGNKLYENLRGTEEDKKVFDKANDNGLIIHKWWGNSKIRDTQGIKENLSIRDIGRLIGYNDFSAEDTNKLRSIQEEKAWKIRVIKNSQ